MKRNSTKNLGGRPPFAPTAAQRRKVAIAAGAGMRHEEIAIALGISRPTLAKYFGDELAVAAFRKRLEVIEALHAAAKRGNVSAARVYLSVEPELAAAPAESAPKPTEPPLGKKAQASADAGTAHVGTAWDDDLRPRSPLQ